MSSSSDVSTKKRSLSSNENSQWIPIKKKWSSLTEYTPYFRNEVDEISSVGQTAGHTTVANGEHTPLDANISEHILIDEESRECTQIDVDKRDFFDQDTPHGLAKRIMWKKFLQGFVPVSHERVVKHGRCIKGFTIVDGFSGRGKYGEVWPSEIENYGSPLIALMVTLNYFYKLKQRTENKRRNDLGEKKKKEEDINWKITKEHTQFDMKATSESDNILNERILRYLIYKVEASLIFIEKDKTRFEKLVKNVKAMLHFLVEEDFTLQKYKDGYVITVHQEGTNDYPIVCILINSSLEIFSECFPTEMEDRAIATFLDPFGYKQIPVNNVIKFTGSENKIMLVNFMSSYVNRFHRGEKHRKNISKLFGLSEGEMPNILRQPLKQSPPTLEREGNPSKLAHLYEKQLKQKSGHMFRHSIIFEMRGRNNSGIYHLIFIPGHDNTFRLMKDAMKKISQDELNLHFSDWYFNKNDKCMDLSNLQKLDKLAETIFSQFCGQTVKLETINDYITYQTPFVFWRKALSDLEKEGKMVAKGERRRRFTYPGENWIFTFKDMPNDTGDENQSAEGPNTTEETGDHDFEQPELEPTPGPSSKAD